MADLTIKTGDTFPPLRGSALDAQGLLDLTKADSLEVILVRTVGTERVIRGTALPIDPPIPNPDEQDGPELNWQYEWEAGDTSEVVGEAETAQGTYEVELKATWDKDATPPAVETVDNDVNPTVEIKKALA